jgi:hypothetical protein
LNRRGNRRRRSAGASLAARALAEFRSQFRSSAAAR